MTGAAAGVGYRNVRGEYFLSLQDRMARSWVSQAASMFRSDAPIELYKWLGNAPSPNKFQGQRRLQELQDFGLQVVNDKFESTVSIDVDDLRRDKTGQAPIQVRSVAAKVATLPNRLLSGILNNGGTVKCFDGISLYKTDRVVRNSGTINNDITVSGASTPDAPTSAFMSDAIMQGVQQLYTFNDDSGDPINEDAMEFMVMVPVKYYRSAQAALALPFTSAGVSNLIPSLQQVKFNLVVNPRLTGTSAAAGRRIHILRTDAEVRALLWQEEDIGNESFKVLGPDSESAFMTDKVAFGAKMICAAAPGLPQLACRVNIAA